MKDRSLEFLIAGTSFKTKNLAIVTARPEWILRLRRELDNPYDPEAIAIDAQGKGKDSETPWLDIGYVPAKLNTTITAQNLEEVTLKIKSFRSSQVKNTRRYWITLRADWKE